MKRYLCLFLAVTLLFTSEFAPVVTVAAAELIGQVSVSDDYQSNDNDKHQEDSSAQHETASSDGEGDTGLETDADLVAPSADDADPEAPPADGADPENPTADGAGPEDPSADGADTENPSADDADPENPTADGADPEDPPADGADPEDPSADEADPEDPPAVDADPEDPSADGADTENPSADDADPENPTADGADPENPPADGAGPENPPADGADPENPPADGADPEDYTFSFSDNTIEVTAEISPDSVFVQDDTELDPAEVHLEADTTENERFSQLAEDFEGGVLTVDLSFRTEDGETVEQVQGSTELTLGIPETEEDAVISNVEVFHYVEGGGEEDGTVEQVEGITVDSEARTVSFDAEELGAYAVRYTVDFTFGGREYHMVGGSRLLLSELFAQLGIEKDAAEVERIDFTDDSLIQFSRYDDHVDWVIRSLAPFDTEETMTLTFSDGEQLVIPVTDDQTRYTESPNLADFLADWKITIGDTVFSNDTVDDNTVIEYREGMQYSLELNFVEQSLLGFYAPDYKAEAASPPEMFYQLPDLFYVPPEFTVPLMVRLGRKGVLPDNMVSVVQGSITGGTKEGSLITGGTFTTEPDADGNTHAFLKLTWNWEDSHWSYFCDSSQANLNIVVNGVFQDKEPNVLSINGKDIHIKKEDLRNAVVNKTGSFNPQTGLIAYTVTVSSQGTTSDITLTDTLGSALTYQGDVVYVPEASTNSAAAPRITAKTGNTFNVVIPAMQDGDSLVFRYSAKVDYNGIAISGNPTFEETGNTAQITGDSYTQDNTAVYYETDIAFSDLIKDCVGTRRVTMNGNPHYVLTWRIDTNRRAQYPLADTTITDTIGESIQRISKYTGDGVTIQCYSENGELKDTRKLRWADLGVNLDTAVTWTYHIPDTDPQYRYVLTYDTDVDMTDGKEVVAVNLAEGKGGIDNDMVVLYPPGSGLGVSKRATNVGSKSVTWEITLTVEDTAFDYERLALTEHYGSKEYTDEYGVKRTTWSGDGFPCRWMTRPGETSSSIFKETLTKVEVIGLMDGETYEVRYGHPTKPETFNGVTYDAQSGSYVLEADFKSKDYVWGANCFQLEFYKNARRTMGGLVKPAGDNPSRKIIVRLTTEFPEDWATTARDVMHAEANRNISLYSHVNWISADTPDSKGNLVSRTRDTDKITPMPPYIYKSVMEFADTTVNPDTGRPYDILNYQFADITFTDAEYKQGASSTNPNVRKPSLSDSTLFPVFHYQVLVNGIQFDEPLVIEDTFDTSLFEVITADRFPGGRMVWTRGKNKDKPTTTWTHTYFPKVFGMSEYGWSPPTGQANFDGKEPASVLYGFGYMNGNLTTGVGWYRKAEDNGCTFEKTDTGFRVTINQLFKRQDGKLYPFYGIDYYLVPKSVEALKTIEETAARNGKNGGEAKAPYVNTASARGMSASATIKIGVINDFMPIDKTSEAWLEMWDSSRRKLSETTIGGNSADAVQPSDIGRYVMKYKVVLNKGKERLNDGNLMTAEDEYSSNLSVDFNSIKITADPAEAASRISYDFSGNIGYFTIPDETRVEIEYEATILQSASSGTPSLNVSNEVRMLHYKKRLDDTVDHGGAGGSSAETPYILVKKYATGHMEKGLNGAVFQLYQYKHETYQWGNSNTAADWEPVIVPQPSSHEATFTTCDLTFGETHFGDGCAAIELSQKRDGMTLEQGKVYGLREITTPVGHAANGEAINYRYPHSDTFFCYVFSICKKDETADYSNYVFLQGDTMTIRNTPESISLTLKKHLSGNCSLADAEKSQLSWQLFRKEVPTGQTEAVYMPIMTEPRTDGETPVVNERFAHINWEQASAGIELTGLKVKEGEAAGEYLLAEYGNDGILSEHPDWAWQGSFLWDDGITGTFTKSAYKVYDQNGANERTVHGIPFSVTPQQVKDGDSKVLTLTNAYNRETVTLTAMKQWTNPSGAPVSWPSGKTAAFTLGTLDADSQFTAVPSVSPVTLDNTKDGNGEDRPGYAVFKNLPKYEVVDSDSGKVLKTIPYAVRETESALGYNAVYPTEGADYAAFGTETSVKIKNQMEETFISVSKAWDRGIKPENPSATFRLYAYTGDNAAAAVWMSTINDITLDGVVDSGEGSFGEKEAWRADFTGLPKYDNSGRELTYLVKEIRCTPASYEPIEESAAAGGTITNRPAAVDFTVQKKWLGTPGDAWPEGVQITLQLKRKTRTGVEDSTFSADYVLSSSAIVSQDSVKNNYGENVDNAGEWAGQTLTVKNLPKYDPDGNAWLYYVTETAIQNPSVSGEDGNLFLKYGKDYRDKNHYRTSGAFTYSGGSLTNSRTSLSISKKVTGNMANPGKQFHFTVTLRSGETGAPFVGEVYCEWGNTAAGTQTSDYKNITDGTLGLLLGDGDWYTFLDLPVHVAYTVTEDAEDAAGYQTTYTINSGSAVTGLTASGSLSDIPVVTFVNYRGAVIPTGISLNTPAWLCVTLLSACGPALLWLSRRRRRAARS